MARGSNGAEHGSGSLMSSGLFWALSYGVCSIAITLFNKAVLYSYKFEYPMTLTLCQGIFTLGAMYGLRHFGLITFQDLSWRVAKQVAPLSGVFIAYVVISLAALGRVNVPMFTALRRLTLLFVMVIEFFVSAKVPTKWISASVAVMTLGAAIAAYKDLTFDMWSYVLVFFTNLFTALYTVFISSVKRDHKLDTFTMLWYNNIMTMPVVALLILVTGEGAMAASFTHYDDGHFMFFFFCSSVMAFWLNYSTFQSTSLNSPTTQSVIGQLKNFIAFVLSLVLFTDYVFDMTNFAGLLVGFAGGVWYSVMEMQPKAPPTVPVEPKELPPAATAPALTAGMEDGEDSRTDRRRAAGADSPSVLDGGEDRGATRPHGRQVV
jgi:solute carrier family 35